MSAGGGYNDWESDLSSIIEKTNQNLKLLRRIGDKRSDITGAGAYDVSTTATRPATATSAAQIASDMRSFASSISSRYAAEDGGSSVRARNMSTTGIPRATSASASASSSSKKLHRSSSMGVENARERARESLIIRPTTAFGSDGEGDGEERSPRRSTSRQAAAGSGSATRSSTLKRSSSVATGKAKSSTTTGTRMSATASGLASGNPGNSNNSSSSLLGNDVALDDLRKSLEVHVASRSSAFEKALGDLRTDMTVVTTETNALSMKMHELRDAVTAKLSNIASTTQAVSENGESIGRLEKHSAVLLGWKVGVDQDLFEITTKLKSFASIQEKMTSLESHMEALGAAIKNAHRAARYDEKIDELKDRLAMMERQAAHQVDAKAVEHTVQMRVSKEINELENRIQQSLQFLTQKLENKIQALEKSACSDRIDAIASVKSELMEDIDKLDSKTLKKPELVPVQNAQTQMKDDIAHMQMFFERQDKRFQELKQNSTQIRDELVETRHELTKALHAQQNRVSSTLEEKVAKLAIMSKDKNVKVDQKMTLLEKRHKKIEDQTKALHDAVDKVKHDAVSRRAVDSVTQQRENEKLRQRLAKSIAELEQLHTAKQELERSMESQERQYQTKIKDLRAQVEEQEKTKETQRTELLQAIQNESKQMGYSQGRNALLEALLSREKQENEEKSQQIHKARQEIAQIRQKMRSLESDVDRKMQKLSTDLQSKQSQVDALVKKLKRSEEDAQKLVEAAKREKKSLSRTKELKQQELVATKMKLKEMEKIITTVAAVKETQSSVSQQHVDHTARLAEVESKRKQLELLLTERHLEVQEMRSELKDIKLERDELASKHQEVLSGRIQELTAEYQDQIQTLERGIATKDAEMKQLRGDLVDRSELLALGDTLAQLRSEKESLIEQLKTSQGDHERRVLETESSLEALHRVEMDKLQSRTEERVSEIAALQKSLAETSDRLSALEATAKQSEAARVQEVVRLARELKEARTDVERLVGESADLEAEKRKVEDKLIEVQASLEATSAEDEEQQEEVDRLRLSCEELGIERQRLTGELKAKSEELAELTKLDVHHRERLAEVEKEQDETRAQLEQEIESLQQTLEAEREASAQCERELQMTIDTLEAELSVERKQAQEGVSGSSKREAELHSVLQQLTAATQAEVAVKSKLDLILHELSALGTASVDETAADPASALRKCVSSLTEKHSSTLATLAAEHEDAVKRAAADGVRVLELENQMQELTVQIEELEDSNRELKGDMERLCAEKARQLLEMGRLQEEISDIRDQKHALEEQVEQQLAQYEELDATLHSLIQEKDAEVNELKEVNAGLEKTMSGIHETMEQIETSKMTELDGLATELQELELKLVSLTGSNATKASGVNEATMEKEFLVNQQAIASAGQQIRALHTKLCGGCSILELQDLKASLTAVETKHARYLEESQRNRQQCVEAEEQVLLNVEFLEALMAESDGKQTALAAKYVKIVPSLAAKLNQLQAQFHDALQQCSLDAASSLSKEKLIRGDENPSEFLEHVNESNPGEEEFDEDECDENVSSAEIEDANDFDDEGELEESAQDLNESTSELEVSHAESLVDGEPGNREEQDEADLEASGQLNEADSRESASPASCMTLKLDADSSARADSCTVLVHSPTAALLQEPFQGFRSKPDRVVTLDETPRAESCTTLPHSPTAALLQERFKPFSDGVNSSLEEGLGRKRDSHESEFNDHGDESDGEERVSESQQDVLSESSTTDDHDQSVDIDRGRSDQLEQNDDDDERANDEQDSSDRRTGSAAMVSANEPIDSFGHAEKLHDATNSSAKQGMMEEHEMGNLGGSALGDSAEDELIDSGSGEDADGDEEGGERHYADQSAVADDDAEAELEREDDDELSQSLETMIRKTAREDSTETDHAYSLQHCIRPYECPGDEDDHDGDSEELLSDEDRPLDDIDGEEDVQGDGQEGSEAHSGFNSPIGKAESEFSDDAHAALEESGGADDHQGAGRDDDEELSESSQSLKSTLAVEESAAPNHDTVEDTSLPRRVNTLGSAASNFDSQHDDENESDGEIDASMDSDAGKDATSMSASASDASMLAVAGITTVASASLGLSRLAALRKDSDEEEFDGARLSVSAGESRQSKEDDDEFDQIEEGVDSESDYSVRSDNETPLVDDRPPQQLSSSSLSSSEATIVASESMSMDHRDGGEQDAEEEDEEPPVMLAHLATVESPLRHPLSGMAALRTDSDEEEVDAGSLSRASAVSGRIEKDGGDDEFDDHVDEEVSASDIDEHEDSQLDAGSDFDEIDSSREFGTESETREAPSPDMALSSPAPTVPSARLVALRKHSNDDDDEFQSAQLALDSRKPGMDEDDDDEFGQSGDGDSRQPMALDDSNAHSDSEDNDIDASQDFARETVSTALTSGSTISESAVAVTIPSLPLAALRRNSEDEDEFQVAELAMNARRRGDTDNRVDDHEFDDEGDGAHHRFETSEHEGEHEDESDLGDIDGSQDFGDDVGLPSFDSPKRTMPVSADTDVQREIESMLRAENATADADGAPADEEKTGSVTATAARSLPHVGGLHKESHEDELEYSQSSLLDGRSTAFDGEEDADFDHEDVDAQSASHQFDGSEHDELDTSQQLDGSDVDELDASNEELASQTHQSVDQEPSSTSASSAIVENTSLRPHSGIAALRKDSDEDAFEAGSLSLASAANRQAKGKEEDEFNGHCGEEGSASEIDELENSQLDAGSDFDEIDSSRDFGSESESVQIQDSVTSASVAVSATTPGLPSSRLSALRKDSDDDDDEFQSAQLALDSRKPGMSDNVRDGDDGFDQSGDGDSRQPMALDDDTAHSDTEDNDIDASQDFTREKLSPQLASSLTSFASSATATIPSLPLAALRKNSENEDEFQAAEKAMDARRRRDAADHTDDHEFDDADDDAHHSSESSVHEGEHGNESDLGDMDGSQDFGDDFGLPSFDSPKRAMPASAVTDEGAHRDEGESASEIDELESSQLNAGSDFDEIDSSRDFGTEGQGVNVQITPANETASATAPGVPSSSLSTLRKHSDDDEFRSAQLTGDSRRRGMSENISGDDELDQSGDGTSHRQEERDRHGMQEATCVTEGEVMTPHHGDEDDGDLGDHEFDHSVSFDEADVDHVMETRVSAQQMQRLSESSMTHEDDEEEDDQDGDEDTELRIRRDTADDLTEDSMDEVERLLLQHAEETELHEESDRRFTSNLRMEDEEDEQEDDELIDSDEEEEVGADSMRSDHDSEAAASPVMTRQPQGDMMHGQTSTRGDGGEDENEDEAHDMDEMERLLQDANSTSAMSNHGKHNEESSDEEEEVAASLSNLVERPTTVQTSRIVGKNFDDSEEEDDEVAAAPSPVHLPSSQLLPLSGLGGRARGAGGGSGSLMKALNASRSALGSAIGGLDELDDDMDEVERLMATQSQRKPLLTSTPAPVVSSLQSSKVDHDFDDEEEDEIDQSGSSSPVPTAVSGSTNVDSSLAPEGRSQGDADEKNVSEARRDEQEEDVSDVGEDDHSESMADESGTFGLSFGDDDLDRALASPTPKAAVQATAAAPAPDVNKQAIDASDSDEDDKPSSSSSIRSASAFASSALLSAPGRQLSSLQPLPALGKKPLPGLGAIGHASRMALDEDDDMDEVERLLLQQTSMKTTSRLPTTAITATTRASKPMAHHKDDDEDDAFDAESAPNSPLRRPIARDDDDEFAHFDRDDDGDGSNRKRDAREASSLSDSQGSAASPSRIPILRGSTLLKKGQAPLPVASLGSSPVARPRMASARSEDDYLEDSFDLEESLQEEVEEEEKDL